MEHSLAYLWLRTPDERKATRVALEAEHHQLAESALPRKWKAALRKGCLIVSNTDKRVVSYVESYHKGINQFLDENLGFIGEEEYVRRPVFYISSKVSGTAALDLYPVTARRPEIRINRSQLSYLRPVSLKLLEFWFTDRDVDLYAGLPEWFRLGLNELIGNVRVSGSKTTFAPNQPNRLALRTALKAGAALTTQELLQLDSKEAWAAFVKNKPDQIHSLLRTHARVLVEYLLVGKGSTSKYHRDIVPEFLSSLGHSISRATSELDEAVDPSLLLPPKTIDEENRILATRRYKIAAMAEVHLKYAYFRTFKEWTKKDWDRLEKAIEKEL